MIVVEGPDGSGKTTLCKQICERYGLEMGMRGTSNRDEIYKTTRQDTWFAMWQELEMSDNLVWDRIGPISDPIYSAVGILNNRFCAFTPGEIKVFQQFVDHLALVIVCLPPFEVVQANVETSHQLPRVKEQTGWIWQQYYTYSGKAHFVDDYTSVNPLSIEGTVDRYLLNRKSREYKNDPST